MTYSLEFDARALKEWQKLGGYGPAATQEKARFGFAESESRGEPAAWLARLLQDQAAK